jgi:hypothetical protein
MMLSVLMLFGMLTALFVYGMVDTSSLSLQRDKDVVARFADVKRALIGWSVQRTPSVPLPNARPGELPCPDMNNDGLEDGTCVAGAIGRVPWKTLGIPEPKDDAGGTLWYAIAGPFRIWAVNNDPIHSDTRGSLTVYQDSTASAITTEAIAVLFAAGAAQGAQNRDPVATALCPTTGTTIAKNLCAANYLETTAGVNNATTNGPFIAALSSGTFNDKVMAITTSDLMPVVERRVAREVRTILQSYKTATAALGYNGGAGVYPWVDCSNGGSDYGDNRGRFPSITASPVDWGSSGAPTLPNWLVNQGATLYNWGWVIHYAVGRNFLEDPVGCTMCEVGQTSLSVNGVWGTQAVIIMTGPAGTGPGGGARPLDGLGSGICPQSQWAAYLDDGANNDLSDDRYVTPASTAYPRDRLYTIP